MIKIRNSEERGQGNFDWLKAKYTFSFANYHDPKMTGFSDLLVINEDRIAPGKGFDMHPHQDMEIITYVINGALEHKDSLGNHGVIRHGDIQYMSAGAGVVHSEFNHSSTEEVHLLQIWIRPQVLQEVPLYGQFSFSSHWKKNELCLIASNEKSEKNVQIRQDAKIYTFKLECHHNHTMKILSNRVIWVQMIRGQIEIENQQISAGDGAAIFELNEFNIHANVDSEFLLFDLKESEIL